MRFGLYIHVPFCEQRCHYCAFPVAVMPVSSHESYVRRLETELRLVDLPGTPDTVYLGGGTPSLLAPRLIRAVFEVVPSGAQEISIEVNPGTLDPQRLEVYQDLGINRVSLGAQSFDPTDLLEAGRLHAAEDSIRDYEMLRQWGFENVNLDLIAGLPEQRREAWSGNLDWIERLRPAHVSVYLLEVEDSSLWGKRPPRIHAAQDHAWFYSETAARLGAAGYRHYEVSSWALPGRECRHNLCYWTGVSYRGVGIGAHSFMDGRRFWNTRSMAEYALRLDNGQLPIDQVEESTPRIRLEESFLLGLRCMDGLDVWSVAKEIGIDYPQEWFDRLDSLREAALVEFDGSILRVTPSGWLLVSGITEELLCPSLLSICEAIQ